MVQPEHAPNIRPWLRLRGIPGVGPALCTRLVERFGDPAEVLAAAEGSLAEVEGVGHVTARKIVAGRGAFDADAELALADRLGVTLLHRDDPRYPTLLKRIYDPPPILYVQGHLIREHALAVALVGSRRCTIYGREQAAKLAYQLGASGFTVVSGLARGIDAAAHQGALAAGAQTLAVQGCGLSRVFPPENEPLYRKVTAQGACLSELPLTSEPLPHHFPARNRIIAGLSLGVVIVEATERSGALITARCALEQNREVLAVPGPIDSALSRGPHRLLRDGATLVTTVQDIVAALGSAVEPLGEHVTRRVQATAVPRPHGEAPVSTPLSDAERRVLNGIGTEPRHADQLAEITALPAGQVTATLVTLQLKGLVRGLPGQVFVRR